MIYRVSSNNLFLYFCPCTVLLKASIFSSLMWTLSFFQMWVGSFYHDFSTRSLFLSELIKDCDVMFI